MKKIILASTSPRRRELLKAAGIAFEIVKPDFDESIIDKDFSCELIEAIAENKGKSVMKQMENSTVIISADTVVIFGNKVLGKPKDYKEAKEMLDLLNGNTHKVVTAVCVIDVEKNKIIVKSETSEVTFNRLTQQEIEKYIKDYKPYDKAGSYGIQELPDNFIDNIKGEYDNIVGLPVKLVKSMLNEVTLL